jgi:SpoVK/Ycf46/Vps4 family AAA+-type ATPase
MTNRVEMIDPAIMRRGRFDHVIKVDFASEEEVRSLLDKLLSTLPRDESVDPAPLAKRLAGRPLSDVTFVVREGARLSARASRDKGSPVCTFVAGANRSSPGFERQFGKSIWFRDEWMDRRGDRRRPDLAYRVDQQ